MAERQDITSTSVVPEDAAGMRMYLKTLRDDFDAHNHDGSNSRAFQTTKAETVSSRVIQIRKTSYASNVAGIWMGLVGNTMKLKLGDGTNYLQWDGTTLTISGTITGSTFQTASSGQRIVISSADNTLRFYDSSGQVIGIGSTALKAINLSLTSVTNNGVAITSSVAGVGYSYTSGDDNQQMVGLDLSISSGGGTNSLPAIRVAYGGTAGLLEATILSGKGIFIQRTAGSGTANLISLQSSNVASGTMFDITRTSGSGSITAINIDHTTTTTSNNFGIVMGLSSGTASACYAFRFNGSEAVNAAVGGSQNYKIRISVGGTDYFIPCNTA